jgi:hypothetical protein
MFQRISGIRARVFPHFENETLKALFSVNSQILDIS